ncbi:MAG: copper resistance, partial [Labilithrix sp.]|nr:copper resistance [Labilithrix sp.]
AAMTWIGGMIFLVTVLVPMLRQPHMRDRAMAMFHLLGVRFRRVGWFALTTLLVTGVINVLHRGYRFEQLLTGEVFAGTWGHTLGVKLVLVALIFVSSVVHDFYVGPTATRLAREGASPERRERLRRLASWMGRSTLLLALTVVAFAIMLVRGTP